MSKFMTIVIKYEDGAELADEITRSFKDGTPFQGAQITAVSLEDEISKNEMLEIMTDTDCG